ncbi:MAG: MFS transporter, partial [Solirubrobacteraceae bacterium]
MADGSQRRRLTARTAPGSAQGEKRRLRALLYLTTSLMLLELVFFGVLSPMLPGLKREFELSTSQAGVLVAMYAVGAACAGVPALLLVARKGVRCIAISSLAAFALTSIGFGLAPDFAGLMIARMLQGMAGAACWTAAMTWLLEVAPVSRRGAMLGFAFGVSEAGAIAGPLIGGLAAELGRAATFGAVGALCLALAYFASSFAGPTREHAERIALSPVIGASEVRTAMWIALLPAVILAAIGVLGPLQQHRLGAGIGEIAATFGIAAGAGILVRPAFGRWSDRRGPRGPIRAGLLASFPVVLVLPWLTSRLALAAFIVLALVGTGVLWAPLMMILSDACTAAGVGQAMAVGVMSLAWPPGNVLGSAGAGASAQLAGAKW